MCCEVSIGPPKMIIISPSPVASPACAGSRVACDGQTRRFLTDQAKPFPSSDAVTQRRQHALVPHRGFHPPPISSVGLCALCSPLGHYRRLAFALPLRVAHASTFLPPVPRRCFAFSASRGSSPLRYHEGSDSCAAHLRRRSPRFLRHTFLSFHLQPRELPGHRFPPRQRDQRFSGFALASQARRSSPPNRVRYPTDRHFASGCSPPRLGATQLPSATEFVAYSDTDFHRADVAPSQAHDARLRGHDAPSLRLKHALRSLEGARDFNHPRKRH